MSGETYTVANKSLSSNSSGNCNSQRSLEGYIPDEVFRKHSNHTFTILSSSNDTNSHSSNSIFNCTDPPLLSTFFHSCHSQEVANGRFVGQRTENARSLEFGYLESHQLHNTFTIDSVPMRLSHLNPLQSTYSVDSLLSQSCACPLSNTFTIGPNGDRIFKTCPTPQSLRPVPLDEGISKTAIVRPSQFHNTRTINHPRSCTTKNGTESQSHSTAENRASSSSCCVHADGPWVEVQQGNEKNPVTAASANLPSNSKDIFSNAEFLTELSQVINKARVSSGFSQDPIFFIVSQNKAYDHFRVNLEDNNNAKVSTQKNCPERLFRSPCRNTGSSSETYFSPVENETEHPHTALSNNHNNPDAFRSKLACRKIDRESCNSVQLPPVEKSLSNQKILNPIVLVSRINTPGIPETSSSPKRKPSNYSDVASASSSIVTVLEVKSNCSQNQNKKIKLGDSEISESTDLLNEKASNILNRAYIAKQSGNEKEKSVCRSKSQTCSESSFPGEISKHTSKSGSSSKKIYSSSASSSSCIIESSVVDHSKKFTKNECSHTSFSKSSNSELSAKSLLRRKTKVIHPSRSSLKKNSRRKRRRLFKKLKIVQRRKTKRIAEKTARTSTRKQLGSGSKSTGAKSHERSCITIPTSSSFSSCSPSIVECSVILEPLLKNVGVLKKKPQITTVSNKPSAICSKSCQTPLSKSTANSFRDSLKKQWSQSPTNSSWDRLAKQRSKSPSNSSRCSARKCRCDSTANRSQSSWRKCKSNSFRSSQEISRSISPSKSSQNNQIKQRSISPANSSLNELPVIVSQKSRKKLKSRSSRNNQIKPRSISLANGSPSESPFKISQSRKKLRSISPTNSSSDESLARSSWSSQQKLKSVSHANSLSTEFPASCSRSSQEKLRSVSPANCSSSESRVRCAQFSRKKLKSVSQKNSSSSSQSSETNIGTFKSTTIQPISEKQVPVKPTTIKKSKIFRLCELNYFYLNTSTITTNQDFLAYHGLLPTLRLNRCTLQANKRKQTTINCSVHLVDCKKARIDSPFAENHHQTDSRKKLNVSLDRFSYFKVDPGKKIRLSSSKKEKAECSDSSSNNERCTKISSNLIATKALEQKFKSLRETEHKSSLKETKEKSKSVDDDQISLGQKVDPERASVSATSSEPQAGKLLNSTLTFNSGESTLTVKACLMQISPRISENIISAVCCHCNNLIPYGLAKTQLATCEVLWPSNNIPLCPSEKCNGRRLYFGVFKTKLVLKTEKGDYLIAYCATPHAEQFFDCTVREYFEDPAHQQKIKDRINELLVSQKKREKIIFKEYNLLVQKSRDQLRVRIVDTNVFDP